MQVICLLLFQECEEVEEVQCANETASAPVAEQRVVQVCADKMVPKCAIRKVKRCTPGTRFNSYRPFECTMVPEEQCIETVQNVCEDTVVAVPADDESRQAACESVK